MSKIHFKYVSSLEDCRAYIESTKDGERYFDVGDGEPEDSNLGRDFADCYSVEELIKKANEDGLAGIKYEITSEVIEND